MKRRHHYRTELKYDFGNRRFDISVLALCAVLLIVALPYRNHLIAFGGSTEGEAWLCTFTYAITSEKALLFFPLLVPLATATPESSRCSARRSANDAVACARAGGPDGVAGHHACPCARSAKWCEGSVVEGTGGRPSLGRATRVRHGAMAEGAWQATVELRSARSEVPIAWWRHHGKIATPP